MQRSRRKRLPEGYFVERDESDDFAIDELIHSYTDEESEEGSDDSDDDSVADTPSVEVDRFEMF